jgi:hypothetical protein
VAAAVEDTTKEKTKRKRKKKKKIPLRVDAPPLSVEMVGSYTDPF